MNSKKNKKQAENEISGIICSVASCAYNNKNGHCVAKQVDIGPMRATSCTETVCATYKPEPEMAEGRIF